MAHRCREAEWAARKHHKQEVTGRCEDETQNVTSEGTERHRATFTGVKKEKAAH